MTRPEYRGPLAQLIAETVIKRLRDHPGETDQQATINCLVADPTENQLLVELFPPSYLAWLLLQIPTWYPTSTRVILSPSDQEQIGIDRRMARIRGEYVGSRPSEVGPPSDCGRRVIRKGNTMS